MTEVAAGGWFSNPTYIQYLQMSYQCTVQQAAAVKSLEHRSDREQFNVCTP